MQAQNYYDLLEVSKDADPEHIKRQYRKLVLQAHPDKGGSVVDFQRLQDAYATLRDSQRRKLYDQHRLTEPLTDLLCEVPFTLKQGFKGHTFMVQAQRRVLCGHCSGSMVGCDRCSDSRYAIEDVYKRVHLRPGAQNGQQVVFPQCGHRSGQQIGNMVVVFKLQLEPNVRVIETDVVVTKHISVIDALVSNDVAIEGADGGRVLLKFDRGSTIEPDSVYLVRGQGYVDKKQQRGDLYVQFRVQFPKQALAELQPFARPSHPNALLATPSDSDHFAQQSCAVQ